MNIDFSKVITKGDKYVERLNNIKNTIAAKRYMEETSGILVNGFFLNTGRDSQALLTGAALEAFMDDTYTCRWKTAEGFIELDSASLITISREMRKHVQACFNREADLLEHVDAGTYEDSMLEEGWPNEVQK